MGVRDVSLTDIVPHLDGGYSLYGENFTAYTRVYVNGEEQEKKFLNNTRIDLPSTELKEGDVIYTCQYGSSDTLFRKADDYIYQDGKLGTDKTRSWVEQTGEEE